MHTCKNCGNSFEGKFCNLCGEKVYSEHDKSISHLFHEVVHFFTHFDGALFTTFKTIIKTPGKYSLDFCEGIRKRYFKPIPLFLLFVVLYLLFPRFHGLNMLANTYINQKDNYSWFATPLVEYKMKKKQVAYEEVARNYDEKSPKIAKLCLLLLLPMGALVTAALFYRSKRVYFDHFILSVETSSFYVFLLYLFVPLIATLLIGVYPRIATVFSDDSWLWIVFAVLILVFQVLAFRRFFKEKWPWTILKAVIYSTLFSVVVKYIYIMIVFYLTMLFV